MARPTEDPDPNISPARRYFADRMRHLRQELGWTPGAACRDLWDIPAARLGSGARQLGTEDGDDHRGLIAERGRMAWQKTTGYGRRNLAETAIDRYKALIGPRLRARNWRAQKAETVIVVSVLNRMIQTAKPVSVRVA